MILKRTKKGKLDMRCKINKKYILNLGIKECLVCNEKIIGEARVYLDCGHNYCVNCFAQHMRLDNRCGLCRQNVCCKPINKPKKINYETIYNLISTTIDESYRIESENENINILLSNFGVELLEKVH